MVKIPVQEIAKHFTVQPDGRDVSALTFHLVDVAFNPQDVHGCCSHWAVVGQLLRCWATDQKVLSSNTSTAKLQLLGP